RSSRGKYRQSKETTPGTSAYAGGLGGRNDRVSRLRGEGNGNRPPPRDDDASSRSDGTQSVAHCHAARDRDRSAGGSGARSYCHRYRADGDIENWRSLYLRRLQRQSEIAFGRSRPGGQESRAVHRRKGARLYRTAECGRRTSRHGIGTLREDVERRPLGVKTRKQAAPATTRDARKFARSGRRKKSSAH